MSKDTPQRSAGSGMVAIKNKADSSLVSIKSNVSIGSMPVAVSALMKLGISAQVAIRGTHAQVVSAMNILTSRFQAASGLVSLRGAKPAGEK
jgi:hypothetical protein